MGTGSAEGMMTKKACRIGMFGRLKKFIRPVYLSKRFASRFGLSAYGGKKESGRI